MKREQKIKEIINRGVEAIYPSKTALEKTLKSNKKLRLYHGIDPTAKSLHLGHLIQMLKLKQFQDLGHQVIILIGDFTGMIGDPTDKAATRKPLTRKQVLANAKNYKEQIGRILNLEKTEFRFNSEWWDKMEMSQLIEWAAKLSASQLWQRDMFQERLKQGREVHLHELLYPLFQGYDSVALDVDLETGGSDQIFNMLVGRTLMKTQGKEKMVLAMRLLTDPAGIKMGKTEGNAVNLADSPKEMYGKIMSWPDELIVPGFELGTQVSLPEVYQIKDELLAGKNPKILKMLLAYKIVELNYGKAEAIAAEENFKKVFEKREVPKDIRRVKVSNYQLLNVLVKSKLARSKTEARRLIKQGGVKIDGKVVKDEGTKVQSGAVVQRGKRHFVGVR
jgi:tyrosyl-tRNA synthetase